MATMNNADALDAIVALLDGTEWGVETVETIAAIVRAAGYVVRDPSEMTDAADEVAP